MMYFSCDVGKFLDSKRGLLDPDNYDYESLMGTTFGMDKKQRIQTFSSGSSHAMTLMAVDLDKAGKPKKMDGGKQLGTGCQQRPPDHDGRMVQRIHVPLGCQQEIHHRQSPGSIETDTDTVTGLGPDVCRRRVMEIES